MCATVATTNAALGGKRVDPRLKEIKFQIQDGLDKIDQSRETFTEGTLQVGKGLLEAREAIESDTQFGSWLSRNGFKRLDRHTRAALMNMARHEELSRQRLAFTDRRSWRYIWDEEIAPHTLPTRVEPIESPKLTLPAPDSSWCGYVTTPPEPFTSVVEESPKESIVEIGVGIARFVPVDELKPKEIPPEPENIQGVGSQADSPSTTDRNLDSTIRAMLKVKDDLNEIGGMIATLDSVNRNFWIETEDFIRVIERVKSLIEQRRGQ